MKPSVIHIPAPEYDVSGTPDYARIGGRVDAAMAARLGDGTYVARAIGSSDHEGKTVEELTDLILELGTDKYLPGKPEVAASDFRGYDHDFHGTSFELTGGRIAPDREREIPSLFGDIIYHFREHAPLDRGYPVRIDVLIIYRRAMLQRATLADPSAPRVREGLERHLFRFENRRKKRDAVAAVVQIT